MTPSQPLGRIGTSTDVAEAIMFLASERASSITGPHCTSTAARTSRDDRDLSVGRSHSWLFDDVAAVALCGSPIASDCDQLHGRHQDEQRPAECL